MKPLDDFASAFCEDPPPPFTAPRNARSMRARALDLLKREESCNVRRDADSAAPNASKTLTLESCVFIAPAFSYRVNVLHLAEQATYKRI